MVNLLVTTTLSDCQFIRSERAVKLKSRVGAGKEPGRAGGRSRTAGRAGSRESRWGAGRDQGRAGKSRRTIMIK